MSEIPKERIEAAIKAYVDALAQTEPCPRCAGKGHHHGFGEHGHDPDYCDRCGGCGVIGVNDEFAAMAAALAAAPADDWRDIASAHDPDGETKILVTWKHSKPDDVEVMRVRDLQYQFGRMPTHWQPLPAPPAQTAKEGGT